MNRLIAIAGAALLALLILVPVAIAADPGQPRTERVLISINGDVTLADGDRADAVVVVRGVATVLGDAKTIVVVDGAATVNGAAVETIVAVRSGVTLGPGTVVSGDVVTFDSDVTYVGDARVVGNTRNLVTEFIGIGWILAPVIMLLMLGVAIAGIFFALLLAALAPRQVRISGSYISHEPLLTAGVALLGIVAPIILIVALFVSIVGAPLGLAILLGLWPLAAAVGYLVAAIWVGDLIVRAMSPTVPRERPYLAAVTGVVVLTVCSVFPPITMIASFFGYGALLLFAWRSFKGTATASAAPLPGPTQTTAPMGPPPVTPAPTAPGQ